ncbi:hypothetical protein P5V15_003044 [Pogonomyrmex californicus]
MMKRELREQLERERKKEKDKKEDVWTKKIRNIEDGLEALEKEIERAAEEKEGTEESEKEVSERSGVRIKEVEKLKRWITEKDREERQDNIVLKGIRLLKEKVGNRKESSEWAQNFIKEKIGVECKVNNCWNSGEIGEIFIENDLSWEERKMQERISSWVKEKKGKGIDIKIRLGRVKIGSMFGLWKVWSEIEREAENNKKIRG